MNRRGFLLGLGSSVVMAPAVVRSGLLMPVKRVLLPDGVVLSNRAHPMPDYLVPAGQILDRDFYPELFKAIGYTYGGEGEAFRLPSCSPCDPAAYSFRVRTQGPWAGNVEIFYVERQ